MWGCVSSAPEWSQNSLETAALSVTTVQSLSFFFSSLYIYEGDLAPRCADLSFVFTWSNSSAVTNCHFASVWGVKTGVDGYGAVWTHVIHGAQVRARVIVKGRKLWFPCYSLTVSSSVLMMIVYWHVKTLTDWTEDKQQEEWGKRTDEKKGWRKKEENGDKYGSKGACYTY